MRSTSRFGVLSLALVIAGCGDTGQPTSVTEPVTTPQLTLHGKAAKKYRVEARLSPEESREYVKGAVVDGVCQLTVPPKRVVGKLVEIDEERCEGIAAYSAKWMRELIGNTKPQPFPWRSDEPTSAPVARAQQARMISCTDQDLAEDRWSGGSILLDRVIGGVMTTQAIMYVHTMAKIKNWERLTADFNEFCAWGMDSTYVKNTFYSRAGWYPIDVFVSHYTNVPGTYPWGHAFNPAYKGTAGHITHVAWGTFKFDGCPNPTVSSLVSLGTTSSGTNAVALRTYNYNQTSPPAQLYATVNSNTSTINDFCGTGNHLYRSVTLDFDWWEFLAKELHTPNFSGAGQSFARLPFFHPTTLMLTVALALALQASAPPPPERPVVVIKRPDDVHLRWSRARTDSIVAPARALLKADSTAPVGEMTVTGDTVLVPIGLPYGPGWSWRTIRVEWRRGRWVAIREERR